MLGRPLAPGGQRRDSVSPETSLLPRPAAPRGITPSKPTMASVLRGRAVRQGLVAAAAAGGLSRSRADRAPPAAGVGRYSKIHCRPPGAVCSVPALLTTARRYNCKSPWSTPRNRPVIPPQ